MDEYGRVVAYQLCKTKEHSEIIPLLEGIKRRYELNVH